MVTGFLRAVQCCFFVLTFLPAFAQPRAGKYNSQLWEITGKGMKKPSYLFGTMHVSNKLAFHLGDSFYNAIRNVDIIALEQDPELWQSAIPRITRQSVEYQRFSTRYDDDYLKESSFAYEGFKGNLRSLLAKEPQMTNALLYRTEYGAADYEENTYLDLYIYQTGRKLGKAATGVEDFMTTERISMEAQEDERKAQKKGRNQNRNYNQYEVVRGIQDAYRKGDLDALDSLNKYALGSEAFKEKFLYLRNQIQADAMDSIIQKQALFVGVGAAHLPGKRGVIEMLRTKGYRLRPIYMGDYDARQKESIDTLRVPVSFNRCWATDSLYSVDAPGPLIPLEGSEIQSNYADMANGSYYLVTRMKTMPLYNGYTESRLMRIIDSLMYEAVPGKILSKKEITRNGFKGYDLTNRTRRGDMQRYNIFAMPSEIVVFKMGGTENYVAGPEAERFFSSIRLREQIPQSTAPVNWSPAEGGFSLRFPQTPVRRYTRTGADRQPRLELEARDPATGDVYTLLRKDMYSFDFLEEDSFEAYLMTESLLSDPDVGKPGKRTSGTYLGYASHDVNISVPGGELIRARAIVQGPHEYLLAVRSRKSSPAHDAFLHSLQFSPSNTGKASLIQDTFLRLEVQSPVKLELDEDVSSLVSYSRKLMGSGNYRYGNGDDGYSQRPERRFANFMHESSGQVITVHTSVFPEYHFHKDSLRFWKNELRDASADSQMHIAKAVAIHLPDGTSGYDLTLSDTGSSRQIRKKLMLHGNTFYSIQTVIDSRQPESDFVKTFFATAVPYAVKPGPGIFEPKTATFFTHYYSPDTVVRKRAKSAASSLYFGSDGFPRILEAIANLDRSAPDYYQMKTTWINELGYISDSAAELRVTAALDELYRKTADTTIFQNAVLKALAQLRNPSSTQLLKKLLTEDPPVFDNNSGFGYGTYSLFNRYADTLKLAASLFPDLLQLAPIQDYKTHVVSLLAELVDSGYVKPESYRSQLPALIFDARLALKKQQAEDDLSLQANQAAGDEDNYDYSYQRGRMIKQDTSLSGLYDYAVLLMPFYDENPGIPKLFERLLQSQKPELRARTGLLMLRHKKPVPGKLWSELSGDNIYQSRMFTVLKRVGKPELFVNSGKERQRPLTESALRFALGQKADTLVYLRTMPATLKGKSGKVYFYKYKAKNDADWSLVLTGIQPNDNREFNDEPALLRSGINFNDEKPQDATLEKELRQALIRSHEGGSQFYSSGYDGYFRTADGEE